VIRAAVLTVALLVSACARAEPPASAVIDCSQAETQLELNRCAADARLEAEARLQAAVDATLMRLQPNAAGRFHAAQQAWEAYRDAHCAFVASGVEGGSAEPMVAADCLRDMALARQHRIEALADCPEGDLACPR
jgi:uncharacterized protein YecT (DUF1311 family)